MYFRSNERRVPNFRLIFPPLDYCNCVRVNFGTKGKIYVPTRRYLEFLPETSFSRSSMIARNRRPFLNVSGTRCSDVSAIAFCHPCSHAPHREEKREFRVGCSSLSGQNRVDFLERTFFLVIPTRVTICRTTTFFLLKSARIVRNDF